MRRSVAHIRVLQDAYVYVDTGWMAQNHRKTRVIRHASSPYGYGMRMLVGAQKSSLPKLTFFKNPIGRTLATMLYA